MTIRAKFKLDAVESTLTNRGHYDERKQWVNDGTAELRTLKFSPVYGGGDPNHENTKFWQASPSGSLSLGTVNPEAWAAFELGKEYYLDFTPAE